MVSEPVSTQNKAVKIHLSDHEPQGCRDAVTLVVAARNEMAHLPESVPRFLALEGVTDVVIVDDHSDDGSWAWLCSQCPKTKRLRVIRCPDIPPGWTAKSFALSVGASAARTPFLLFTDADVSIAPTLVKRAVRMAISSKLDHVSGFFKIVCISFWEKCCGPLLAAIAVVAMELSAKQCGAGIGGFTLVRKATYDAVGGHASFRNAVVDDVSLARRIVSCGGKSVFLDLSGDVRVRLFSGATGFFKAVERSTTGFLGRRALLTAFLGGLITFSSAFAWLIALVLATRANVLWLAAGLVLIYFAGCFTMFRYRRYHTAPWIYCTLYLFALPLLGAAVLSGASRQLLGAPIQWRGRTYTLKS